MKSSVRFSHQAPVATDPDAAPIKVDSASGGQVDASCSSVITITCIQQLYNAVGFTPSGKNGNKIGITGYLEQFANFEDLQTFYARERPDALGSNFTVVPVNGTSLHFGRPAREKALTYVI